MVGPAEVPQPNNISELERQTALKATPETKSVSGALANLSKTFRQCLPDAH